MSARFEIPVVAIEFDEGGKAIWVQQPSGTVLRIQCSGQIKVRTGCTNNVPHADINVVGDIEICIPNETPTMLPTVRCPQCQMMVEPEELEPEDNPDNPEIRCSACGYVDDAVQWGVAQLPRLERS